MKEFISYVEKLRIAFHAYYAEPSWENLETLSELEQIVEYLCKYYKGHFTDLPKSALSEINLN